ncbi:acyltransferase family protein [Flavobacterium koreense]
MRIEQLTFTRFVAAFAIIIYHFGSNVMPFNISFISPLVSQFSASVSYFFMLSGFIMIVSYWNKGTINWADYMKNRMARIYPVYFLALFIALFTAILKLDVNLFDVLYNLLMIQTWIPERALTGNPPGWSISVEFFFYFIFPFLLNYIYKPNVAKHYLKIILGIVFLNVATQIVFYIYLILLIIQGFRLKATICYSFYL